MDCGESGSTLRFLIPLAALDGNCYNFIGEGELGTRPLTPYETLFKEENLHFHYGSERHFPLSVQGPLKSGHFDHWHFHHCRNIQNRILFFSFRLLTFLLRSIPNRIFTGNRDIG